jgi:DNA-directed RNA polymerase subunit M/transcription elongation factor TFIIS
MAVVDPKKAKALMIKANLQPLEPYTRSMDKWKCKCMNCGQIVYPKYCSIKQGQGGCKYCAHIKKANRMKVLHATGKISYKKKRPRIDEKQAIKILKSFGRSPKEPFQAKKTPWLSKCNKCGTVGKPPLSLLIYKGKNSCKTCGVEATSNAKKLSQSEVKKTFKLAGVELLVDYTYKNDRPLKCRCLRCKRIVTPTYANAKKHKEGCKYCSGTYVDPNDAKKLMVKLGYLPKEKYKGTDVPWKLQHIKCGNISYPTYGTIKRGGGGCRNCANWGYQFDKPSYIYLITHDNLYSHKVGIANKAKLNKSDRLHKFKNHGWQIHKVWEFEEGHTPIMVEAQVLKIIRKDLGIPQHLAKGTLKYEGETETISADSITLLELEKIIKKVIKGYRNNP